MTNTLIFSSVLFTFSARFFFYLIILKSCDTRTDERTDRESYGAFYNIDVNIIIKQACH